MNKSRTIVLSLVLAAGAFSPAAALAKHGADDNPAVPDNHGAMQGADDNPAVADNHGAAQGADDHAGDDNDGRHGGRVRAKKVVRVAGSCTGTSTSKLKVKRDRGRLKAEFEVDQNVAGVAWAVKLSRNGTVAVNTTATTHAPSGSFSIERRLMNGAGPDVIAATATSPSGETCTATATV
jgi:hypothetical protein